MEKPRLFLIDANVLLRVYLMRLKRGAAVAFFNKNSNFKMCISPITIHIFMYYMKLHKQDMPEALIFLEKFLVLPLDGVSTKWALANCPDGDYEDALQVACAVFGDCEKIATFDIDFAKNYSRYINVELIS